MSIDKVNYVDGWGPDFWCTLLSLWIVMQSIKYKDNERGWVWGLGGSQRETLVLDWEWSGFLFRVTSLNLQELPVAVTEWGPGQAWRRGRDVWWTARCRRETVLSPSREPAVPSSLWTLNTHLTVCLSRKVWPQSVPVGHHRHLRHLGRPDGRGSRLHVPAAFPPAAGAGQQGQLDGWLHPE